MQRCFILTALLLATALVGARHAVAGQAPAAASAPVDNKLVGTIRLGDPLPANLSPLYKGQLLVHGMGFSPDHRTIAVVAIGSNAGNFFDNATNNVKIVTYFWRFSA